MGRKTQERTHQKLNQPLPEKSFLQERRLLWLKRIYYGIFLLIKIEYDNFPFVLFDEIKNRSDLKQKYFD